MYEPLMYMEQIENMITVRGRGNLASTVNRKSLDWCDDFINQDHAYCVQVSILGWHYCRMETKLPDSIADECSKTAQKYANGTGMFAIDGEDFWLLLMLNIVHADWCRNKRVYKIEENMLHDLSTMSVSHNLPSSAVTKLPTKCFYLDWDCKPEYCPDASGMFVLYDVKDGYAYYSLITLIKRDRIIPIITLLKLEEAVDSEVKYNESNFRDSLRIALEDNSTCLYNETMAVKLFYNFCAYLSAMNSDVEYTERTRSVYRPAPEGAKPKNKIREVEEFGVGFRYTTIRKKTVVKYTGEKRTNEGRKRSYSSCYRAAHWQHYWINYQEDTSKKKRVLKWIEGTYVRGNKSADKVNIHVVK